ncbi:MAG: fumarylacetoacetate hydrolase family protein [Pseudanabaenaceae cyanobacterium SKYGB_i_bin29]|nr:fumarylacetoacetate hydrolase family protein [Pseudanabaenaceae cyanobacterium SKYG29]MDW8420985.1 fumarylacetoacetate hydrolase family protein [Pseudanabaenaceae cyanobacterium SKYGB_i_bin29]
MAERYVRVQGEGGIYYGLLEVNLSVHLLSAAPWLGGEATGKILPPETYTLLPPCEPQKIVGVGKNYRAHALELGTEPPKEPLIFLKATSALIGSQQPIILPTQSSRVEYEGELALVIGQTCRHVSPDHALNYVWGYTIANDVTARDLQRKDGQWTRAKSFDTFCPLGPWIVRDISPAAHLQTILNNDSVPVQSATIDEMLFPPDVLVSFISSVMTLYPGDVILTGTPAGVGRIAPGDQVAVEIEGIGRLQNPVLVRSGVAEATAGQREG